MLFSGLLPLFVVAHLGHHLVEGILRPLTPMIRTDLGLSYTQVGIVILAFAITSGISQLPGGWLSDRLGSRVIVGISVSGVAIAGLLIGFSQSYVSLIVFLVIAAILGGGYHPASITAISESVPPERRGRALGFHLIGGTSTFWVAPLLAAPIAAAWGWRGSYIALSIPAILLGIVLYFLIGQRMPVRPSENQTVRVEKPSAPTQIRWRKIVPFIIMSVTTGTISYSVAAYLALYAVDHFGITETAAAMLTAIMPAVGLFAAPLGGYLSDRIGRMLVLITACLLAAPITYLVGVVPNVPTLAITICVLGIINSTRMPTSEAYIVGHTPEHRRSTILGFYFFAGREAAGLLTPVIGNLIDRFGFYWSFTIAGITIAVVTIACSLLLWINRD